MSEQTLLQLMQTKFAGRILSVVEDLGEVTVTVSPAEYHAFMAELSQPPYCFEQLSDLCGVDYLQYQGASLQRFAVVVHLLSVSKNRRLRVRVFAEDEHFPLIASVTDIWTSANWYEREAFDLYGIIFVGHEDLRRLLTDYGFVGHPFRKDFPISGHVEMRYDPDTARVIYQPVTIAERENVPRVVRSETDDEVRQVKQNLQHVAGKMAPNSGVSRG